MSLRGPRERNFNAVSYKSMHAPIQSVFKSWWLVTVMPARCSLILLPSMSGKTCHWVVCRMQRRNSIFASLSALTAFGEERCRQSKRKLDVLVHCMKFSFFIALLCTGHWLYQQ